MLKKLMKYEWKSFSKMGLLMLGGIFLVTLLGVIGFALPMSGIMDSARYSSDVTDNQAMGLVLMTLVSSCSIMVYIVSLIGIMYGLIIYIGVHFYKTMYSDEGYLTHTLPVTPKQLIVSKILISSAWYAIVAIAVGLSVLVLTGSMMFFMEASMDMPLNLRMAAESFWEGLAENISFELVHMLVVVLLNLVVAPFATTMTMLGALTLGQLTSKHRVLMGILVYFGINMGIGFINQILQFVFMLGAEAIYQMGGNESYYATGPYDASLLTSIASVVIFYFITKSIITNRLNLE